MANLTQTATGVVAQSNAGKGDAIAGATIVAGQPIYLDSTPQAQVGQADTVPHAACVGVALNGGAVNQPIKYQSTGDINLGATLVVGETYVVSGTAGAICPIGDLVAGKIVTILGVAKTTSLLTLNINATGIVHA